MAYKKQFEYKIIRTDTGEYEIYLDWSISGKLFIEVIDREYILEGENVPQELFSEEIDLVD